MLRKKLGFTLGGFSLITGLFPVANASNSSIGAGAAQFLTFGAGARALGMGEAYGPIAEGADAIYWNPAGLAQMKNPEISYSHVEMIGTLHHDFASYAHPISSLSGTIAGSASVFYQDSLPLVSNTNQTLGAFRPHSEAFSLAYARSFGGNENVLAEDLRLMKQQWNAPWADEPLKLLQTRETSPLMAGIALKVIRETLADRSASAVAADGGAIYLPPSVENLRLSFAFRNIGSKEKFIQESENLPMEIDIGSAYDLRNRNLGWLPAFEMTIPYYGQMNAKFGIEYTAPIGDKTQAALRLGYKTLTASDLSMISGITAGIGAQFNAMTFDFGFQPMAQLGEVYRLSFNWRF